MCTPLLGGVVGKVVGKVGVRGVERDSEGGEGAGVAR